MLLACVCGHIIQAALNKGGDDGEVVNIPGSGDSDKMKALPSYSNVCMPGRVVVRTSSGHVGKILS